MKNRIFIALAFVASIFTTATAQQKVSPATNPKINVAGNYNSSALGAGTAYSATIIPYASTSFPLYTKTTTVTNTGVDTLKGKIEGAQNSVYTWVHATQLTGTNTSCTVKLWASADSGRGVDFIPIQTFTVSATNPVGYQLINSGYGWPYTNWMWTFTGVGTHTTNWYSGVMVR